MLRMTRRVLLMCLAATVLAGCSGGEAKLRNDLKQVGLVYMSYHDQHGKGPPNWDELTKFAQDTNLSPASVQSVRDAGYQVKFEVELSKLEKGSSETVLAEKPGSGMKLYCDGSVQGQ